MAKKGIPKFITKLYELTNATDDVTKSCLHWDAKGEQFFVSAIDQFSSQLLPLYFSHNNYSSFVRQLNLYQFKRSTENKGKIVPGMKMVERFSHESFKKGRQDLLVHVKRQPSSKRTASSKGGAKAGDKGGLSQAAFDRLQEQLQTAEDTCAEQSETITKLRMQNKQLTAKLSAQQALLDKLQQPGADYFAINSMPRQPHFDFDSFNPGASQQQKHPATHPTTQPMLGQAHARAFPDQQQIMQQMQQQQQKMQQQPKSAASIMMPPALDMPSFMNMPSLPSSRSDGDEDASDASIASPFSPMAQSSANNYNVDQLLMPSAMHLNDLDSLLSSFGSNQY